MSCPLIACKKVETVPRPFQEKGGILQMGRMKQPPDLLSYVVIRCDVLRLPFANAH